MKPPMTRPAPTNNDNEHDNLDRKIRTTEIIFLIIASLVMSLILVVR